LGFSSWERSGDFDVLTIGLDGDCLACVADILQIKLNGLFDILEHFHPGIALRHTSRQGRDCGYVPAVTLALKNRGVFHVRNPSISALLFIVFPSIKKVKAGGV
jgi:hypothetical protein